MIQAKTTLDLWLVRTEGLEPSTLAGYASETYAYTNSATSACCNETKKYHEKAFSSIFFGFEDLFRFDVPLCNAVPAIGRARHRPNMDILY